MGFKEELIMPDFRHEVDVDIEIDVDEFLGECSSDEIEEVIEFLVDNNYIKRDSITDRPNNTMDNVMDESYKEALDKLYTRRIYLTLEEEQFIHNLANKF